MIVLGIETSCDETSVALVKDDKTILAHIVASQINDHQKYGGVVPEIAARAHLQTLPSIIQQLLSEAHLTLHDIDAIAATGGPGLIGGVSVGLMVGKSIAAALEKPFIAVNHLEGHALTARLSDDISFPFLLLLVSGGHCQLLLAENVGKYIELGYTLDDAVGECFDKVAKMLNLPYPGGPSVENMALDGDPLSYKLPSPMIGKDNCNFSFSGLKTSVKNLIQSLGGADQLTSGQKSNICASFQLAVCNSLGDRVTKAVELNPNVKSFVVAGGVASNQVIRSILLDLCSKNNLMFFAPPLKLCTDNGAMIAWAGIERYRLGLVDDLDFKPRPRWPINQIRRELS